MVKKYKKHIYKNYFSRDFSLAMLEVWWRGEVTKPKIWTSKKQPFLPYIIFENIGPTTNGWYDPQGIEWVEEILIDEVKRTGNFDFIEKPFRREIRKLEPIYKKELALNKNDLVIFFRQLEAIWPWFEGMWWGWESIIYDQCQDIFKKQFNRFTKLREESQYFVPGSEAVIRKSLKKIYPSLGDLSAVMTIKEIAVKNPPRRGKLEERINGYFFTNNQLFVGKTRSFIEDRFNIRFEKTTKDKKIKEFKGQAVFKGIVKGVAKIIYGARQVNKVNKGDIIVAPMTLPDVIPAMKKAAAFITDEGGIVCHAAIIAREMKKPCIVGTKIATQVLKDGDLIEVDANKGVVKKLK